MNVTAQHDVFHGIHVGKEFNILKRPCNTHPGDGVRGLVFYGSVVEPDLPPVGSVQTGDTIEKRGFSRTVGADYGKNLPLFQGKADILEGSYSPKGYGKVLNRKKRRRVHGLQIQPSGQFF